MSIELLPSNSAFTKGADLWIISNNSSWLSTMDWHSSLMISKYQIRTPSKLSDENLQLIDRCGFDLNEKIESSDDKLMLIMDKFFPNQSMIILAQRQLKDWAEAGLKLWSNLNFPSVRFFLPPKATNNDFLTHWPQDLLTKDYLYKVSLISDTINPNGK